MKVYDSLCAPEVSQRESPVNSQYGWIDSLAAGVTEDFISVEKIDECFLLNIKLFVEKQKNIVGVILYFIRCGDEMRMPLSKASFDSQDVWSLDVNIESEHMLRPFSYRFKIITSTTSFFYDSQGAYKYKVNNATNFKFYYKCSSPEWLESAVVYHIFVDRFKKSLPAKQNEMLWASVPVGGVDEFYGGDILGIIDRLGYLMDLGVNTICLTPIFKSSTNHRYDVEDYFSVDEGLGGDDAFKLLSQLCREKNIRIVLDGVFNHVSARSPWFNRDSLHLDDGAYQNINSPYSAYFSFKSHPEQYDSFWSDKYLPKLNYRSANLRNVVYRNKNSIIKYWMNEPYAVAGWRLDACCMIGKYNSDDLNSEVLTELYAEAKKNKKDCYIFGENPFDPSEVEQYRHMDGITNYSGFYTPLISWLDSNIDFNVKDFDAALGEFRALIGHQFTQSSKNFLGNHDKSRLYRILDGDLMKYSTALAFLFSYPGVPSLYYGEEIGLQDDNIIDDGRICMRWDSLTSTNIDIYRYTQKLIGLYKKSKAIQKGSFKSIFCEDEVFIYERFFGNEFILVVLNNSIRPLKSISIKTNSIVRLSVKNLYSCLDGSLRVCVFNDNVIEIQNIETRSPIIISSRLYV